MPHFFPKPFPGMPTPPHSTAHGHRAWHWATVRGLYQPAWVPVASPAWAYIHWMDQHQHHSPCWLGENSTHLWIALLWKALWWHLLIRFFKDIVTLLQWIKFLHFSMTTYVQYPSLLGLLKIKNTDYSEIANCNGRTVNPTIMMIMTNDRFITHVNCVKDPSLSGEQVGIYSSHYIL